MSVNLLNLLSNQMSPDLVSKIAGVIGENSGATQSALNSVLPALLAGTVQKTSDSGGAGMLWNLLNSGNHNGDVLSSLGSVLGSGDSAQKLMSGGAGILSTLFGDKIGALASLIGKVGGINSGSANSLLSIAAPLVMGMIGKTAKSQGISSASGLASMLAGQKGFLKSLLPAGLGNIMSLSSFNDEPSRAVVASHPESGGLKKLIPWLLLAGVAALLFALFGRGCQKDVTPPVEIPQKVEKAAATTGGVVDAMANWFKKVLPSGFELNAPPGGVENQMLVFIDDTGKLVDKDTWFNFDRLTFETGSATLDMTKSSEQLTNVAEIMKAYPNLILKIGGYTDNVGDPGANLKLSSDRAANTVAALVNLGVAANRLSSEGYGEQHSVASNNTEEGRAQNRRIAIRVDAK